MYKDKVVHDKLVYVGTAILDLSKLHMILVGPENSQGVFYTFSVLRFFIPFRATFFLKRFRARPRTLF